MRGFATASGDLLFRVITGPSVELKPISRAAAANPS